VLRAFALAAALACACLGPASMAAAMPTPGPPVTIDGPSPDIVSLGGLAVARDGTGGLVYTKQVAGVPHVFVSRLLGGVFQPPEQVDPGLPGASEQPVIAASSAGALAIAFINAGSLFVLTRATSASPYTEARDLFDGATNPAIGMTLLGKAYLAFTAVGAGGHDVRAAYFARGVWSLESTPLDAHPADDAGTGSGRPAVAAASDGVGIVAWGEAGHVYSRRVWATSPSGVCEQDDVPVLGGWPELSADEPSISTPGDSSYADIVFHEVLGSGSVQQSRVRVAHLRASQSDLVGQADGLTTPGAGGADHPEVALNEYGRGFITSERGDTGQVIAAHARANGYLDSVYPADSLPNATPPYAVPGIAGLTSTLIGWQHDPGSPGTPEILARYAQDGSTLGPELVLSSPGQGPTDAADGLSAGGDISGDAALTWVQGASSARRIVAAQMYQPPGAIAPSTGFAYLPTSHPALGWTAAKALWGPIRYLVSVDGSLIGQTTGTSLQVPVRLRDGRHSWEVTAVNPAGLTSRMRPGSFWTDTVAPLVSVSLTGKRRVGAYLHARIAYTDAPSLEPPSASSGIADVLIRWGDGSRYHFGHGNLHAYRRPGRYTVTVTVTDRAGNATTVSRAITIASPGGPRGTRGASTRRPASHGGGR